MIGFKGSIFLFIKFTFHWGPNGASCVRDIYHHYNIFIFKKKKSLQEDLAVSDVIVRALFLYNNDKNKNSISIQLAP